MPPFSPDVFEKLGVFYLGARYDLAARRRTDEPLLYDSRDLVTHAVCVGMTGSGKTGLGIALIEEAALDGVPVIAIDPKGDLSNLLLTFPELRPEDFAPWVNADDARRKGLDPGAFAAQQAGAWREGLAGWAEDGERIRRLRASAAFTVYTPGSTAGVPVSILGSLAPPSAPVLEDAEALRERVAGTAAGLLGLLGIDADPLRSREHILLSTILQHAWTSGAALDMAGLIAAIQSPPVTRLGVMDLETAFPTKDRAALAMGLNNLLAAPAFAAWTSGAPLDLGRMLRAADGRARVAIFSIAHLPDAERMFFVSLLLEETLAWMRAQSGTTSLRAVLYMDEIAGYMPPVANPASKAPLLRLLKQARAYGLGVVLATQNPVVLDYKGLANAGTWFLGRLQTEQDKARVLDGLAGAASAASGRFDRAAVDELLSSLGARVFLMHNVHEDEPVVFETRWALSYLRGPMTRDQVRELRVRAMMDLPEEQGADARPGAGAEATPQGAPTAASDTVVPPRPRVQTGAGGARPVLPPDVPAYFAPVRGEAPADGALVYLPMLLGTVRVRYDDPKLGVDLERTAGLLAPLADGPVAVDWDGAREVAFTDEDVLPEPVADGSFEPLPAEATRAKSYDAWRRSLGPAAARRLTLTLLACPALGAVAGPGENERAFRLRLAQLAREARDDGAARLRSKYAPRLAVLDDRIRRAKHAFEVQQTQAREATVSTAVSIGSAILGAFLGRRKATMGTVGRAATAARGAARTARESGDVGRAVENLQTLEQQRRDLESEFQAELAAAGHVDAHAVPLETRTIRPKRTGVAVRSVVLAWIPAWALPGRAPQPAW